MLLLLIIGMTGPAGAAILVDNFSSAANDRFQDADSPDQFIARDFDLSGLGQDSNGRWATLIGPNTILSANHFRPSGTVTFRAGNDPSLPAVQRTVTSDSQRIGNTDLWLARLDNFLPPEISFFDYATTQISQPNNPFGNFPFKDEVVFMVGRSPTSFPNTLDQALGLNRISSFTENDDSLEADLGVFDSLRMNYNPGDTAYEAFYRGGDSGSPLLWDDGQGGLLVLGVASYTSSSGGEPVASFVNYIGNDSDEVDSIVASYAAIPEPSAGFMLSLAFALLFPRRR